MIKCIKAERKSITSDKPFSKVVTSLKIAIKLFDGFHA